ncbi:cytochrome P450 [Cantharellus anzutake]|uniref:cytochrome P450 n=1 Tax=Cantharellus anzutake TaxID=1750568 RepID=UPI0019082C7B|nr:cytochrome P450 [Cantharellus anzutake]KAF8334675.1 cytochrome P450 [Cantharellus anzutake]
MSSLVKLASSFSGPDLFVAVSFVKRSSLPLPPGPPKTFYFGNAHQIPSKFKYLKFMEWSKQYGDVMHLTVFGAPVIVLNSVEAVTDLLEKKSAIYSSRPRSHMADIMGYSSSTLLAPYGEPLRRSRKLMSAALNSRVSKTYHPIQERVAQDFAYLLLENPQQLKDNIKRATGSAILEISYGYKLTGKDDPHLPLVEQATHNFGLAVSGGFWIDYLPFLRFVPLPLWWPSTRKYIQDGRSLSVRIREELHQYVKRQMAAGTASASFTSMLLQAKGTVTGEDDEEEMIKRTSSILYGAGSDSSCALLEAFFLAMILHPEVQKKAQAELDAVIGNERFPTMQDRSQLPYMDAIIKETIRWAAVVPLAVPHALIEEDEYRGMRIPKGSTVIGNVWSIFHNPSVYEKPFEYIPERFLAPNPPLDPFSLAFGFGRRQCPGMDVASATAFLSMSTTLHSFDILFAKDANGNDIKPKVEWSHGLIAHAAEHPANIVPRSAKAVELIRTTHWGADE